MKFEGVYMPTMVVRPSRHTAAIFDSQRNGLVQKRFTNVPISSVHESTNIKPDDAFCAQTSQPTNTRHKKSRKPLQFC